MKKNLFELFLEKVFNVPLWIKQVIYLKLSKEMQQYCCEDFLRNNSDSIFSTYIPILTFKGKTELESRSCGLDLNIYNFLQCCANDFSLLEISVNTFLSMEEVAKYFELCVEQNFIKTPDSTQIHAMSGFISGKFRTGEYFKQNGTISVDQLQIAILNQKNAMENNVPLLFGQVLSRLGYVEDEDLKALFILKEEAKKRFILDYNTVPKTEAAYTDEKAKYQKEINDLKEENFLLKRKMLQLLELVKRNEH